MRAVTLRTFGAEDVIQIEDVEAPHVGPDDVLIKVAASGVNRADVLQRQGHYPPPPGASDILGLECAGVIVEIGQDVTGWRIGDEVCALLSGGGYADFVAVPAGQVLPVPQGILLMDAAALPEVCATVWSNVFMFAQLSAEETLLIHGGSSGIGTMAIQLAKQAGARVAVTAGSAEKLEACKQLGADILINYREQNFAQIMKDAGGADVILDMVGAKYLERNIDALAPGGRLVIIGMQGGVKAELNIGKLLTKRGCIFATSLRSLPIEEKADVVEQVRTHVWPLIEAGVVEPVIHAKMPLENAADAHRKLAESQHIGKILLTH